MRSVTIGDPEGVELAVLEHGATLHRLWVPDATGRRANVVLGAADLAGYLVDPDPYFGAVVGRCANRIAGGRFRLDGVDHDLVPNEGPHTLHGGPDGFHRRRWSVTGLDAHAVELALVSEDGDQGFPGRVEVTARYAVAGGEVAVTFTATTDAPTIVNLTHHAHFHLGGEGAGTVDEHELQVNAERVVEVGGDLLPTGRLLPVSGTALDLRRPRRVGDVVEGGDPLVADAGGLDHCFALDGREPAASLRDPVSGRRLDVLTDQPGLQVYSGNGFDGTNVGTSGQRYQKRAGIALETQSFPDAVHHQGEDGWPDVVLRPGDTYRSTTLWRFSAG